MDIIIGIFETLANMHTDLGWDSAVGEMFQKIADALKGEA